MHTNRDALTFVCRADLRTDEHISILMKQIQSNAFLSKLPEETIRELCRVMKVQSYYRKDRGMWQHLWIHVAGI